MFAYAKQERKQGTDSAAEKKQSDIIPSLSNQTGIPNVMRMHFENLSGLSFDDVRVHYNSDKPAQLRALAYTQGNQVYVAPRQEKHLEHELGHVVQQKKGQVSPTKSVNGISVNDDISLEREASKYGTIQRQRTLLSQPDRIGQTGFDCIQFEKADIITRIMALLNLSYQVEDRNEALYDALTHSGLSRSKAGEIIDHGAQAAMESFSESVLSETETYLIGSSTRRDFNAVFGNPRSPDTTNLFGENFNHNHFANDFNSAFTVSKARLRVTSPNINTVLMAFQKEVLTANEYTAMSRANANTNFQTNHQYYYWQFTYDGVSQHAAAADVPQDSQLRHIIRSQVTLMANGDRKIFHLQGVAGPQQQIPPENKEVAMGKIDKAVLKMRRIAEGVENSTVTAIYDYVFKAKSELADDRNSQTTTIRIFATAVCNYFKALSTLDYSGFYKGETKASAAHSFSNSVYFTDLGSDLQNDHLRNYFILRGLDALYDSMINMCREAIRRYEEEEEEPEAEAEDA